MKKIIIFVFVLSMISCQESKKQENASISSSDSLQSGTTNNVKTAVFPEEPLHSDIFFPVNFRNWKHVKSMILQKGHPLFENFGGIHHIYANEKAMEGYSRGHFPDGSMIVFDLWEAVEKDNAITEGNRKVIGLMYKNSNVFAETGGWIFGAYKNMQGEKVELDWKAQCFSCHASQKEKDYVFSAYRE